MITKRSERYVDGFVLVVPRAKVPAYRRLAQKAARIWKKHGALSYMECMIDDPRPPFITFTFETMTKAKKHETVWFSYITYKSKKHRDQVNAKVMKDPLMNDPKHTNKPMPFDMQRTAYAGFTIQVGA